MKRFLPFILLFSMESRAESSTFSFSITINPHRIRVKSPRKIGKGAAIIITNESLVNVYGKIIDERGALYSLVAIPRNNFESIRIKKFRKNSTYYFVPLSPPYQKLKLALGQDSYEIPPQR